MREAAGRGVEAEAPAAGPILVALRGGGGGGGGVLIRASCEACGLLLCNQGVRGGIYVKRRNVGSCFDNLDENWEG